MASKLPVVKAGGHTKESAIRLCSDRAIYSDFSCICLESDKGLSKIKVGIVRRIILRIETIDFVKTSRIAIRNIVTI